MNVVVNGEAHELSNGTTVALLVERLDRSPRGMAVAVNEEVVPRSTWRSQLPGPNAGVMRPASSRRARPGRALSGSLHVHALASDIKAHSTA